MNQKKCKLGEREPLFRTPVDIPRVLRPLDVVDRNIFLGSCFAERIGDGFLRAHLRTLVNPFGAVYCPQALVRLLNTTSVDEAVIGVCGYHTWLTDTSFSFVSADECLSVVNERLHEFRTALLQADSLFITLGTARGYCWKQTGEVVVNCHKHSSKEFDIVDADVSTIVAELEASLCSIRDVNTRLIVTFTVSPYRYAKYGFHESQLCKAHLLLAVDELCRRHPDWMQYFPAYEIVLDELRDYRFYADDMLHPGESASAYIRQRLQEWMSEGMLTYLQRWASLESAFTHRPMHPESEEYERFRVSTNNKLNELQRDYPMLKIDRRL